MKNFDIDAIVEIPHGSMYKYEMNKESKQLIIDRPLPAPLTYNYGFVPGTLHADGDPLDICIIGKSPIFPLTKVKVVVLGAFICNDNGDSDDKLVAYVAGEKHTLEFIENAKKEIKYYLSTYKEGFVVESFVEADDAYRIIMTDLDACLHYEENS